MHFCIVGTSRCGSTLLQKLMSMHPDVNVLNETHWVPQMFEFFGTDAVPTEQLLSVTRKTEWDNGKNLIDVNLAIVGKTRAYFDSAFSEVIKGSPFMTIREFSNAFIEIVYDGDRKRYWADKTPDYGYHMGIVQTIWPECKFIHIKRLGYPTALSMSRHSGCQLMVSAGYDNWCSLSYDGLYKKYTRDKLPFEQYVGTWRRRMARIRNESQRLLPGTYAEFQFEELVTNPESVLSEITSFAGINAFPDWLQDANTIVNAKKAEIKKLGPLFDRLNHADIYALTQDNWESLWHTGGTEKPSVSQLLQQASRRIHNKNYNAARRALYQVLGSIDPRLLHPDALQAHLLLIELFTKMQRRHAAENWFRQLSVLWPNEKKLHVKTSESQS